MILFLVIMDQSPRRRGSWGDTSVRVDDSPSGAVREASGAHIGRQPSPPHPILFFPTWQKPLARSIRAQNEAGAESLRVTVGHLLSCDSQDTQVLEGIRRWKGAAQGWQLPSPSLLPPPASPEHRSLGCGRHKANPPTVQAQGRARARGQGSPSGCGAHLNSDAGSLSLFLPSDAHTRLHPG